MPVINSYSLQRTIIPRDEFMKCADQIPNHTDRFVFYALYEGIAGELFKEITQAHLSDINTKTRQMKLCTGRIVDVSDKLIDVARLAAEEDEYLSYGTGRRKPYREAGTDVLFKTIRVGERKEANDLANRAQVLSRRYNKGLNAIGLTRQMTPKRLMVSGKLEYMKAIMEREGLTVEETIRRYRTEIDRRYPVEKLTSVPVFMKKYGKWFTTATSPSPRSLRTSQASTTQWKSAS